MSTSTTIVGSKRNQSCTTFSEEKNFLWKIEKIRTKIADTFLPEQTKAPKEEYFFECGHSIGLPTIWKAYLTRVDSKIGVFIKLLKTPEGIRKVHAKFKYEVLRRTCNMPTNPLEYTTGGKGQGWSDTFIEIDTLAAESDCINLNGIFQVKITFILFKDDLVNEEIKRFKRVSLHLRSLNSAYFNFHSLFYNGKNTDVTIETKDGKSLKAHRVILATRSPVFYAMFQHQMTESSSGTVCVKDLSFEGMEAIVRFIYTGTVGVGWKEFIEEIAYAANKYRLKLLLDYCDRDLASTCTPDNAWHLMKVAQLLGMETAEKEIVNYIENHFREVIHAEKSAFLAQKS